MAATVKGTANAAASSSVAIPSHAVGDLIVIWAYRDGSTTAPTKPTASGTVPAWVDIDTGTGTATNSGRTAYFVATATNHTTGTWTNATGIVATVIQGQATSSFIGGHARGGGTATNSATAPSITQSQTTGKSLLLYFYGHRTVTAWGAAPTGFTNKASVATEVCFNTKDSSTSDGSQAQSNTATSSGYYGATVEILAPDTAPTVSLSSPSDGGSTSDSTPDLTFTGTDAESDDVRYNVEVYNQIASDDFTRADSATLGANWTKVTGFGDINITTNQATNTGTTDCASFYSASSFDNNQWAQATVKGINAGTEDWSGLLVRASATDFVIFQYQKSGGPAMKVLWYNGGANTQIGSTYSYTLQVNDVLRLEAVGTTFIAYVNGVAVISGTNASAPSSGKPGMLLSNNTGSGNSIYDNWAGGNIKVYAVSGTDAGFSGSPDNTDPFTSGQAVTYTVQSALADGTYYWRVRGIDPTGTNTYGAWSSTRSFILSTGTITSQTITGKARIEKSVPQTIAGKAAILETTTKTTTGKARITKTSSSTIQGLSRITKTVPQTITGKSSIQETTGRTILGKGSIQKTVPQTLTGLSRISKTTQQTISGNSRITEITSQTITGKSRITETTSQTVTGKSRITKTVTQDIQGKSRIAETTQQTISGKSRITLVSIYTIQGKSRITETVLQTVTGIASIQGTTTQDITGKAAIAAGFTVTQKPITGKACISSTRSAVYDFIIVDFQRIAKRITKNMYVRL